MPVNLGDYAVEQDDSGAVTIRLRGEFDLSNVREIEAAAFELVGAGARRLCLDLQKVVFMDSSMLNLLVNLRKRLHSRGGELSIQPNMAIAKLLEITGLEGLFELTGD